MFIVAVTRWGPGLDQQLPELAKQLGMFPYDLRLRLNGPIPVVVARMPERDEALQLMNQLRAWGHGAIGCDESSVPETASIHTVREFSFEGATLHSEDARHARAEVTATEVYALIHALVLADHQQHQATTSKQFSASRAVLSGGMMMTRTNTTNTHTAESESEERVLLIRRDYTKPMLFSQHALNYAGLGPQLAHSSHDNFASLVARLRSTFPAAFYSAHLREHRRKGSFAGATTNKGGSTTTTTVSTSNASEVELASYLLLVAHARGQL